MSLIASLELSNYESNELPDRIDSTSHYLRIEDSFVISRTPQGETVSTYGDDEWNMKMYDSAGTTIFNFRTWSKYATTSPLAKTISSEMKIIQFARMYLFDSPRKPNSIKTNELNKLARLALTHNISLRELFEDKNLNIIFLPSFAELKLRAMQAILFLFKELFKLKAKHPEFLFAPNDYSITERMHLLINRHPKRSKSDPQQTPIIPTRLYAAFINALSTELDEFNTIACAIVEFYKKRKDEPLFGIAESHARYRDKNCIKFDEAIAQFELSAAFAHHKIKNLKNLRSYVGEIQCAAKFWIHLFTGMRTNEARYLPADSYTIIPSTIADAHIMRGYTTKGAGQNQTETFWMTSDIIKKGTVAARHVGKITALIRNFDDSDQSQYPLFAALRNTDKVQNHTFAGGPAISLSAHTVSLRRLTARWPDLIVQEMDIRELEQFDGFRDWRNDPDIKIGKCWPFATHQCRRSLAVYCARSGLVSIGSLGLQFKHLTEVMTSYYRRGSSYAVNFLNTSDAINFVEDIEYEQQKAQYINYESDVINSASRLWGGEGNRVQVARDKSKPLVITTDRALTEKKFIKGEMAYKLGPIGGCTSLVHCSKISFTSIFACVDCEHSILDEDRSLKNIKRGLNNLTREKALFDAKNPRHQQLESEISEIYAKLEKRGLREKMEALA